MPQILICDAGLNSFFFFNLFIFFYCKIRYTERRERGRSSVRWFTPQVSTTVDAMPIWSQDPGTSSRYPTGVQDPKAFGPSKSHKQGAGWEVELPGLEPVPIWDPGAFKARTLATRPCCQAQMIWFFTQENQKTVKTLLELIWDFGRVAGYKINYTNWWH